MRHPTSKFEVTVNLATSMHIISYHIIAIIDITRADQGHRMHSTEFTCSMMVNLTLDMRLDASRFQEAEDEHSTADSPYSVSLT